MVGHSSNLGTNNLLLIICTHRAPSGPSSTTYDLWGGHSNLAIKTYTASTKPVQSKVYIILCVLRYPLEEEEASKHSIQYRSSYEPHESLCVCGLDRGMMRFKSWMANPAHLHGLVFKAGACKCSFSRE